MPTRHKPSWKARRRQLVDGDPVVHYPEVVFDAVEKVGALGPHPQAPRDLPGAYYVALITDNL